MRKKRGWQCEGTVIQPGSLAMVLQCNACGIRYWSTDGCAAGMSCGHAASLAKDPAFSGPYWPAVGGGFLLIERNLHDLLYSAQSGESRNGGRPGDVTWEDASAAAEDEGYSLTTDWRLRPTARAAEPMDPEVPAPVREYICAECDEPIEGDVCPTCYDQELDGDPWDSEDGGDWATEDD